MSIPGELARRETRLQKLAEARAKIEARAKDRFEQEQAAYQAKLAAREAKSLNSEVFEAGLRVGSVRRLSMTDIIASLANPSATTAMAS